jgi:hypothetical protein
MSMKVALSDTRLSGRKLRRSGKSVRTKKLCHRLQLLVFFGVEKSYKKYDVKQQRFIEDLVLYIAKGYEALQKVKNLWIRRPRVRNSHIIRKEHRT